MVVVSSAVRPEEAETLAAGNGQIESIHRLHVGEVFAQITAGDDVGHGRRDDTLTTDMRAIVFEESTLSVR